MKHSRPELTSDALRARLQEALGTSYVIERELGGGGMSRVFLARELALDRRVVVKVLPGELAKEMNGERFRREIQLVAGLQHPHIVPLLSAGEAAGSRYYTMPYMQGESLRTLREKRPDMSLAEALHILHDVIDALAYAHEHGIVHRDIKPDNILMSGSHAVVTDFGVAKALTAANASFAHSEAGSTGTGLAVGTPAYMAPEQAAGDPSTDHRADIYAWGLLAYELLGDGPPFEEGSSSEMLAAHIAEIPEPVTSRNPNIPSALASVVMRCLEKRPSARPQTAAEVRGVIERLMTPRGGSPIVSLKRQRRSRHLGAVVSVAILGAILAGVFAFRPHPKQLDEGRVAVMPFRMTSADPSLRYLREGMLDLLAAQLTGEGGPRSSDPRTILSAWRRAAGSDSADLPRDRALELAERLGAGQLLVGDISGVPQRLTITASLVSVRDGRADSPRSVTGPADSLLSMVDRLASELLVLRAGEGERIGGFTGVPLPALRAYLDGTALYRRAHFMAAAKQFDRALTFDSTFALAGLGLATASGWVGDPKDHYRGVMVAWKYRDHLNARDRALEVATAGPNFPDASSWAEQIVAKERYAALAPDRADAQFELGDGLFHFGAAAGIPDAHARAAEAFNRAIALDSGFSPAIEHLVILEMERQDSARVVELGHLYLAADSASENRDGMRWAIARARGDSVGARRVLDRRDSLTMMSRITIGSAPQLVGMGIEDAQWVAEGRPHTMAGQSSLLGDLALRHDIAMDRGQPGRGRQILDSIHALPRTGGYDDAQRVVDALFWDGDTTGATAAVAAVRRKAALGGPIPGTFTRGDDPTYFGDLCLVELWSLSHGDTAGARRVSSLMRKNLDPRNSLSSPPFRRGCALILDAQLATTQHRPDAHALVDSLDAFMRSAPQGPILGMGNLAASRMYERLGDTRAALLAIRRRDFFYGRTPFYSTYLRDEARLAEKAGDARGAAEALRLYLALRGKTEPTLQRDVAEARAAFGRTNRPAESR